ncbi:hypothetical protein BHE90_016068 [Fusarium euwallaceae]|uniref:Fe2OG dioxygenase domain-containing protein n=1 Tax=Fusarium euwallaceae TaxID=1147111 RepID=A0A430L1I3_9HYPO|nr:hypothetical protein BHE90_016068 [Fusarium euwallaceae]
MLMAIVEPSPDVEMSSDMSSEISDYDDEYENDYDVLKALSKIRTSAPLASIFKFDPTYYAGLRVYDVGLINAPLQESQARQLIAKARRERPYRNGGDAKASEKIWELEPKHFNFTDSRWRVFKEHICNKIRVQLAGSRAIQANLTKMVIYEEGAQYEARPDTEGMSNGFATLILCLPSKHRGGEMVFEHEGQTPMVYKSCEMPQSFALWYPGVSHKLLPVTSGYRWALIFELVIDQNELPPPTGLLMPAEIQALRDPLSQWLSKGKQSRLHEYLYYMLDSPYPLGCNQHGLKGQDFGHALALKAMSHELPFEVFLGSLDRKKADRVLTLVDCEGHIVAQDHIGFNDDHLLNEDTALELEDDMDDWDKDEHITVVAIVPHDSLVSFLKCDDEMSPDALRLVTDYLARASLRRGSSKFLFKTLIDLLHHPDSWDILRGETLRLVLQAAVQHEQFDIFREVAIRHFGTLPIKFFSDLRDWLVTDPDNMLERFKGIREGASLAISLYGLPSQKFKAISLLAPHPTTQSADDVKTPKRMLDWARAMTRSCLDSLGSASFGREDGWFIVDLALYFRDPAAFLEQSVLPRAKRMAQPVPFHLAFLVKLQKQGPKNTLPVEDCTRIFRETARWLIESSDFSKLTSEEEAKSLAIQKAREAGKPLESIDPSVLRFSFQPKALIRFFNSLIKESTESDDLASLFISKLAMDAPRFPADQIPSFWMSFLNSVPKTLEPNNIPLNTPCYQQLFSAMFRSCIENFVGGVSINTQPPQHSISCGCTDCLWAKEFLADSSRRTDSIILGDAFTYDGRRLSHLSARLDTPSVDCIRAVHMDTSGTIILTVTKTPSEEHVRNYKAWVRRRGQTLFMFEKFGPHLKLLLGSDYCLFLDLQLTTTSVPISLKPVQELKTPCGVKRKLQDTEFIDLTGTTKKELQSALRRELKRANKFKR